MDKENKLEFKLWGKYALFTDPITKIGGEKCSYHIPTYQALKGIAEAVYWKPTIKWIIDKARIMNMVKTESKGIKPRKYNDDKTPHDLAIYTYLRDVEYRVSAHFEWNDVREDMKNDRNENKHYYIAQRLLERGGKRDVFLGARECCGYIEPCAFDEGVGAYDEIDEIGYGVMFHGFDYPTETGENKLYVRLWNATMKYGIVEFPRPEKCDVKMRKFVRDMPKIVLPSVGADNETLYLGEAYE